ncbi:hypothetical protein N0V88_005839 [Collariella sp. IMI 366227]|nr:hypothetical protein N0V88_005839 [Collariella sp. IMI 366227]
MTCVDRRPRPTQKEQTMKALEGDVVVNGAVAKTSGYYYYSHYPDEYVADFPKHLRDENLKHPSKFWGAEACPVHCDGGGRPRPPGADDKGCTCAGLAWGMAWRRSGSVSVSIGCDSARPQELTAPTFAEADTH